MFNNYNNIDSVNIYKIALAFELIEDELVDINNIFDALKEVNWLIDYHDNI